MDRHLLPQKVCQKISVIIKNTCIFVVFKTKRELKCQNELFFSISSKVFVLITEIFWQTFWSNKWRSFFEVVKDSIYYITWLIHNLIRIRLKTEWEPKCPIPKVMMFCIVCSLVPVNPIKRNRKIVPFSSNPVSIIKFNPLFVGVFYQFWNSSFRMFQNLQNVFIRKQGMRPITIMGFTDSSGQCLICGWCFFVASAHTLWCNFKIQNNSPWLSWRN